MHRETDLGTTVFWSEQYNVPPQEYDTISHFLPEAEWYRAVDAWGNTGWVVGFRDFIESPCQPENSPYKLGFGGEIYHLSDRDNAVFGIHPSKIKRI